MLRERVRAQDVGSVKAPFFTAYTKSVAHLQRIRINAPITRKSIADDFPLRILTQSKNAHEMKAIMFWNCKPMMNKPFRRGRWKSIIGIGGQKKLAFGQPYPVIESLLLVSIFLPDIINREVGFLLPRFDN